MLTSNQLNLLITICDMTSILYDKIPERLLEATDELIKKKLLSYDGTIVIPTEKAIITVDAARSVMNFSSILNSMNYKMLINFWHRLVEVSAKRGVHLNVVFKNLDPKHLNYLTDELNKAVSVKKEREEIQSLTQEV